MLNLKKPMPPKSETDQHGVVFKKCTDSPEVSSLNDSTFRVWVMFNVLVGGRREGLTISSDQLSKACGMSRSTFFRCVKTLKTKKLLKVSKHGSVKQVKTLSNHWTLLNPPGVVPVIKDKPFGVNIGISKNSNEPSQSHKCNTLESKSLRIQEIQEITELTNEAKNDTVISDTKAQANIDALTSFLGKQFKELLCKLEEMPKQEAIGYLYKDENAFEIRCDFRDVETLEQWWRLEWAFPESLPHFGAFAWGEGYTIVIEACLKAFQPVGAQNRAAFLTDCQEIARAIRL